MLNYSFPAFNLFVVCLYNVKFPMIFFPPAAYFLGERGRKKKKNLEVILAWIWQVFWKAEIKQEISHFSKNMTEGERYRCPPELSPFPAVEC